MKSKTSYFKISSAIIKDDFRRFWAIPAIGFMFYFFSTIFVIVMKLRTYSVLTASGGTDYSTSYFIETLLSGQYAPNILNITWMSVLSVLLVYRYLHNSGHVMAVHSQPFTRATLMNSHAVTCVLFVAIPILVTGLILLVISTPVYYPTDYNDVVQNDAVNVFARANILRWMLQSFISCLFIMAVSMVAGMVTGTSFHHAVAALGFNAVVPLCTFMLTLYFSTYLFGYVDSVRFQTALMHMSPILNIVNQGYFSVAESIYYIALVIVLYLIAMLLYYKRKLERATDGIVFKAVDVLITLVFGYLGMTALGMIFRSVFNESVGATIFGYIAGAVLAIVIVRMVIMQTVKVFNKKTAVILGCYMVMAVAFIGALNFNLTGYENRVREDADKISINISVDAEDSRFKGGSYESDEAKQLAVALHRMIIENKDKCIAVEKQNYSDYVGDYEPTAYVSITYYNESAGEKKNDYQAIMERSYTVPAYILISSDEMKSLVEDQESIKDSIDSLPAQESVQLINITSGDDYSSTAYGNGETSIRFSDSEKISGLYEALKADMTEFSYEDVKNAYNTPILAQIGIEYDVEKNKELYDGMDNQSNADIYVNRSYVNTIAWLNSNGYGELIQYNASKYSFAVVKDVEGNDINSEYDDYSINEIPQSKESLKVITDSAELEKLYENVISHVVIGSLSELSTSEDGIYRVDFYEFYPDEAKYYQGFSGYVKNSYVN